MATIQISQLAAVTAATTDDVLIINDGDINTRKITFANLTQNLIANSGNQVINGDLTINGTLTTEGLIVDTDLITVDGPNKRIGILSQTPAHTLDVGGNINIRNGAALRLSDLDGSHAVTLQAANSMPEDNSYTWPSAYPPGPNNVLASNGVGALSWQLSMIDPMGTIGDMLYRNTRNDTAVLPIGSAAQVLTVSNAGVPSWENNPTGFADPLVTPGDIMVKNPLGVTTRLPIGLPGQALTVNSIQTAVEWGFAEGRAAGDTNEIQYNLVGGLGASPALTFDPALTRLTVDNHRVIGDFEALGNSVIGDTIADTVSINALINADLVPTGSGAYALGTVVNRWGELWMEDTINFAAGGGGVGSLNFSYSDGYKFAGLGSGNVSAKIQLNAEDNVESVTLSAPSAADLTTSYDLTLPAAQGAAGTVLTNDGSGALSWVAPSTPTPPTPVTRETAVVSSGNIADLASADVVVAAAKTYVLYSIDTSDAAWVTVYADDASRTADAGRAEGTPAAANSGVLAEVVTTGLESALVSPGSICFNADSPATTDVYLRIQNKSGASADIQVTLTYLSLED